MYLYSVFLLRYRYANRLSERHVSTPASHAQHGQAVRSPSVELPLGLELLPRQESGRLSVRSVF